LNRSVSRKTIRNNDGMTLVELMVVIGMIGVLAAIATVMYLRDLPTIRLKEATRCLYFDIQSARLYAFRKGTTCTIEQFPTAGSSNGYRIVQNGVTLKTVNLADFKGVEFGSINASAPSPDSGTFSSDRLTIQPSGLANSGSFYLKSGGSTPDGRMIEVSVLGKANIKRWDGTTYN
jgi:prepilin-type N-terminal cleavage/methylation domain-containing protein